MTGGGLHGCRPTRYDGGQGGAEMNSAQLGTTIVTIMALAFGAQQSATLNVPVASDKTPTALTGCLMPGGSVSMPGSGGSKGTGPAGMNADAANTGAFLTLHLGKKHPKTVEESYTLEGLEAAQLKQYEHSRVEVQGVLLPPPNPDSTVSGTTMTTTTGKKPQSKSAPLFRVTAIKQVPGSCGGQ